MANFDTVREIGRQLAGVEETTMYGGAALKLRGKLVACTPTHSSAEPGSLAVSIDLDQRAGLLADAPGTYYITDHYKNHSIVLVRLSRIGANPLRELLGAAARFAGAPKRRK